MVKYNPKHSIKRAQSDRENTLSDNQHSIVAENMAVYWSSRMERVEVIRRGIHYSSIETLSKRINTPIKDILELLDIPQTTYNKRKKEEALMSGRDSEIILLLTELLDFGFEVFNQENDKFLRWLKKPNLSLGGLIPESLLDSLSGIQEVKSALNRLEYGNLA